MITLMRRFRKSLQIGLLVIIAAFVASLFVFGATGSRSGGGGDPRDSVATVNGETIPIERFQRRYAKTQAGSVFVVDRRHDRDAIDEQNGESER